MLKKRRVMTRQRMRKCSFCVEKKQPAFEDFEVLGRFLSERGKIVGRQRSGVCAKHQRGLTREIKRARFLSLLP